MGRGSLSHSFPHCKPIFLKTAGFVCRLQFCSSLPIHASTPLIYSTVWHDLHNNKAKVDLLLIFFNFLHSPCFYQLIFGSLPFLKHCCPSGISFFTYGFILLYKILSKTFEKNQCVHSLYSLPSLFSRVEFLG